ncbi:TPA: dinitrogenase iron-molybdenum cofactor biosynthesis protein [Candidatus Bathyarchaeota archaeon]|nr:dinitrogenase iron-molybdenum cofactor biosynthesis protein [Candidatus Bathyarchaeota archaeon]
MKVAVSSTGPSLDSQLDPRFGRCAYFIIVDTENFEFEAIPNTAQYVAGGAGIQAAQIVASKGVQAVITGNVGPNAYQALSAAGIKIIIGAYGTVKDAVMKLKSGELKSSVAPTAPLHYGVGFGRGMGRGMGLRRGMGRFSQPQFATASSKPAITAPQISKEQEIQSLKDQMKALQDQLEQIRKRLKELEE